jgi:hypothetical protein
LVEGPEGSEGVKWELGLIYFSRLGIWVAGTGIWPLGMGNEVLKNGNGIEIIQVAIDSQFFHVLSILKYNIDPFLVPLPLVMIFVVNHIIHSTTCEQAYSGQ